MTESSISKKRKLTIFFIPLMLFLGMTLLLFSGLGKDPTLLESTLVGKPLPKFEKSLLFEPTKIVTDKDISGPALLNVFGSWCPQCYQEHPYLMKLAKANEVKIYGLNYKDSRQGGLKFINDLGNPYNLIIFDQDGHLGIDLGVYGAPETFVLDADNKIVYRHVGVVDKQIWTDVLSPKILQVK